MHVHAIYMHVWSLMHVFRHTHTPHTCMHALVEEGVSKNPWYVRTVLARAHFTILSLFS